MFFWSTVFDSGANSNKLRGTFVSARFQGLVSTSQKKLRKKVTLAPGGPGSPSFPSGPGVPFKDRTNKRTTVTNKNNH